MRTEFLEYAFLSSKERDTVVLPSLDASKGELAIFTNSIQTIKASRGEQPDEVALPLAGALRGDIPLSSIGKAKE